MSCLVPCRDCGRHAKLSESSCPFCGGTLPRSTRRPRVVRQMTRAMLFFGGATLAACSTPDPAPVPEPAPVVDMTPMQPVAAEVAAVEPSALPSIEAVVVAPESSEDARAERAHAERRKHPVRRVQNNVIHQVIDPNCCMPYGAPPFDFGIV